MCCRAAAIWLSIDVEFRELKLISKLVGLSEEQRGCFQSSLCGVELLNVEAHSWGAEGGEADSAEVCGAVHDEV